MVESLIQPFRRNLNVAPVVISVGDNPTAVSVPPMTGQGITSFLIHNPCPFWVWFRGWQGAAGDMPAIRGQGHYLPPAASYLGRTQMPNFVAAQADDEPGFPIYDTQGNYAYTGQRMRLVMLYGSGA